jgi:Family of unknown function (DUF5681)
MDDSGKREELNAGKVGYRNPPKHTRFKKGESGNPKGRPKGTLNMATVLARTLREKVIINENGQRKVVTKLEAAVKQLVNKAASGDLRALRHLAGLVLSAEEQAAQTPRADAPLSEDDQKVVQGILQRFENAHEGGEEDANYNQ